MVGAFISGVLLGVLFFGGLWFTLKKAFGTKYGAIWISGSALLRMGITLFGFFYASEGSWQRLLICLAGFIAARFLVLLVTKKVDQKQLELQKNVQP